jgi:hypothetical protein
MEVAVTTTLTPPDDDPTYDEPAYTPDDAAYAHALGEARMEDYWMARRAAWYRQQREKNGEQ